MKVKELIELLQELNQEAEVFLSGDSEGNYFSPAADDISVDAWFDDEWEWVHSEEDDDESLETEGLTPGVILWSSR